MMEMITTMTANFQLLENKKKFLQEPNCPPSLRVQLSHRWKGKIDNDDNDDDGNRIMFVLIMFS